jgi:general secretion pathway protein E
MSRVSLGDIQAARQAMRTSGEPFWDALRQRVPLQNGELLRAVGDALKMPTLAMREMQQLAPAFDLIAYADALQRQCIAFRDAQGDLLPVIGTPFDAASIQWAETRLPTAGIWHLAEPADIVAYLSSYEETQRAIDGVLSQGSEGGGQSANVEIISLASIAEDSSQTVKAVNSTLYDALKSQASDIHLETTPGGLTVKYRIDGVLCHVGQIAGLDMAEQVISRLKVMSELDIAERRVPQDGRFKISVNNREIDFRVSIMPSLFGEDAVLRVLDKQSLADQMKSLRLETLGFDAPTVEMMRKLAQEPYGMLLVTGPTGSGKSTTLYAAISEVNNGQDKIITIEDPVEYMLPGVLQIPVNEKKGLTFARGLRSILRHDPDKILVGEIRDAETAQIAVQAALTGHLVYTTVHANNVFDVIGRFAHMGVDTYSFVSALNGILAQRLVRKICEHCAEPYQPDAQLLLDSGLDPDRVSDFTFRIGRGCGHCRGTGYKGRKALAEILKLNDTLRELIISRAPVSQLKEAARKAGMRSLRDIAISTVRQGQTTLQEINRVTFVS